MDIYNILIQPVLTEKSSSLNAQRKYTVAVRNDATKIDIRRAVETMYNTKVDSVSIINLPEKERLLGKGRVLTKRVATKKAIITLKKGEKAIDFIKTKKSK